MSTHPLVDPAVLARLRAAVARFGNRIVEHVPTPEELASFFADLESHSAEPLHARLLLNQEDGSVLVTHAHPAGTVNLCTVAHDYSRVGREPFRNDWADVRGDEVASAAVSMLDPLQLRLLYRQAAYFHSAARYDPSASTNTADPMHDRLPRNSDNQRPTYTLRTAYRRANHAEPVTTEARALAWRPLGWSGNRLRPATPAEATVWAICHVVASDPRADMARLRHVRATIRAVFDTYPKRRAVPSGNAIALLSARLPPAHDPYGRVRYPILRSAACDAALLGEAGPMSGGGPASWALVSAQEERKRSLPLIANFSTGGYDSGTLMRAFCSTVFLAAFVAIALYYTLSRGVQRSVLITWILWGLVIVTAGEIAFMYVSLCTKSKTLHNLVSASKYENMRMQVDIATSPVARSFYNGCWLSFSGDVYYGHHEFKGKRFMVSDLMMAGYETTLCMDGREGLVTPWGQAVRLERLDHTGGAVFNIAESESPQLNTAIIDGVRGTWLSDVATGRENPLSQPRNGRDAAPQQFADV